MHVHPEIAMTMVARQVSEMDAAAASARLARQARAERAAASAVLFASGTATAVNGRSSRRQRLLGRRWIQGQSQPA